jgi:hypothetical protein
MLLRLQRYDDNHTLVGSVTDHSYTFGITGDVPLVGGGQ